jgi:cyclopropane-fatty-acyl-phospholipid synthase
MNDITLLDPLQERTRPPVASGLLRGQVLRRLEAIADGHLVIRDAGGTHEFGPYRSELCATVEVRDPAFYADVALGGAVGAGESYILGRWDASDLPAALRILARNRAAMDALETGWARLAAPLRLAAHALRRNTRAGSRRNIAAHYDLGNELFELFLDETLMYSCALFERPGMTLAEASVAKLEAVCRKLELGPGQHVLEIGTGWGGFALHAAREHGCRVTTTTISPSQHRLASERVREAGLGDRVTVLLEDYRDLRGTYDRLVSIEMIEAIGHRQYGEFFSRAGSLLSRDWRMLLQAITIADRHYAAARDGVDFIKRYVFPGCTIPSVSALCGSMAGASDLRVVHLEDIGPHYATTLAHWRERFLANAAAVRSLGYPDTFIRLWEFYLAYCEAGFGERTLGNVQMVLTREGA